jgi:hypothetical protein
VSTIPSRFGGITVRRTKLDAHAPLSCSLLPRDSARTINSGAHGPRPPAIFFPTHSLPPTSPHHPYEIRRLILSEFSQSLKHSQPPVDVGTPSWSAPVSRRSQPLESIQIGAFSEPRVFKCPRRYRNPRIPSYRKVTDRASAVFQDGVVK